MATGLLNIPQPDKSLMGYTPTATTAEKATVATYDPKAFAVTPEQTVQGQIKNIVDADSPLMQQARTRANQEMQSRGLLNSSIAVGAGQNAVLDKALPIAQQDAQTYYGANTNTVNAQNAAAYQNAQARNQASLQDAQLATNVNLKNADSANVAKGFGAEQANRLQLAQLDSQTRMALAEMDNQYRQLLQQNQGMSSVYNQVLTDIANISMNKDMSQAAKNSAVQSQLNFLREAMAASAKVATLDVDNLASLDLSSYFKWSTVTQKPGSTTGGTATGNTTGGTTGTTGSAGSSGAPTPGTASTQPKAGDRRTLADGTVQEYYPGLNTWKTISSPSGNYR